MLVLGLILIVIAALALLAALVGGANDPATLSLGSVKWETNAMWLFVAGAVALLLLVIGIDLVRVALRKARQRRRDAKELDRLSAKLERQEEREREREDSGVAPTTEPTTEPPTERTAVDPDARTDEHHAVPDDGNGRHRGH